MNLKTELLPHQRAAVGKLIGIRVGALYMEMGTGKTRTALEMIARRLDSGKIDRVLWLCPCSIRRNIALDVAKHADGIDAERFQIHGIESLSGSARLFAQLIAYVQGGDCMLVVDESNLVKNKRAIRSQRVIDIARHCKYRMILNGTPISKCEADLFSQWYVLDWRILGYQSFWTFAANHLEYDENVPGRIVRTLNVDYLTRKIAPYMYQVTKAECMALPPKNYHWRPFSLTREQEEHYDEIANEMLFDVDELKPTTIYRMFSALQAIVSGRRIMRTEKPMRTVPFFKDFHENPRIREFLDTAALLGDEKCVVYARYEHEIRDILAALTEVYGEGSAVPFYGDVPAKKRDAMLDAFRGPARFLVANKACAGYGLNLQFCSRLIYYSHDWDYATRAQSEDRVHRIGQGRAVEIYDIMAADTIDRRMLRCLNRKEGMVVSFKDLLKAKKDRDYLRKWIDGGDDDGEAIFEQNGV